MKPTLNQLSNENFFRSLDQSTTIFWFRRDLRLKDNAGLYFALKENTAVLPVFIFDTEILDKLEDKIDRRVDFIYQSLLTLKSNLEEMGSSLLVLYGNPLHLFEQIHPKAVYTNQDYEPYARRRDEGVMKTLALKGVSFKSFKDQVIFDRDEILKDDGKPYTVFTPYSNKWKSRLNTFYEKSYPNEKYFHHLLKINPLRLLSLEDIGFEATDNVFPKKILTLSIIEKYDKQRNFPAIHGTSRLSVHLRFGTVSIRDLVRIAMKKNMVWLNELIWREFYQMILWHFPQVETNAFKSAYDRIQWRNNEEEYDKWINGITGYPIVDAGMRELNETGFMHNRVRMIVASFLTKHLLIDWRWGETYFARKLLDFDLASNNGGWQWAAGSGCDASPYFRVFSPDLQTKKFDADLAYIKKWVPEFDSEVYPKRIVDHAYARERALRTYKNELVK